MISALHFDHRAAVYRSTESESASLRVVERSWATVDGNDDVPIALQARRQTWENRQGGEKVGGEWMAYAEPGMDVAEGDVLQVTSGPQAPLTLKVDSAYPPRAHHMELVLIPFDGSLS